MESTAIVLSNRVSAFSSSPSLYTRAHLRATSVLRPLDSSSRAATAVLELNVFGVSTSAGAGGAFDCSTSRARAQKGEASGPHIVGLLPIVIAPRQVFYRIRCLKPPACF